MGELPPSTPARIADAIPLRRLPWPGEIALTATFILEIDYISGRNIEVDGALRLWSSGPEARLD